MSKKGQTEDIFADAIPGIIILIVTLMIVWGMGVSHKGQISAAIDSSTSNVHKLELITSLRVPIDATKIPEQEKTKIWTVADVILLADKKEVEDFNWLFSEKLLYQKVEGTNSTYECGKDLPITLSKYSWVLTVKKGEREFFKCYAREMVGPPLKSVLNEFALQPPKDKIFLPTENPEEPLTLELRW
ncbi:hypothetical protein HY643_02855 [Candidatus Woesearchaeota archaeon]|nr:hypothetical protein [Candidatus Woesearchaeota archaeon]